MPRWTSGTPSIRKRGVAAIHRHGVTEEDVKDVLRRPSEDRPGREGLHVALGLTENGVHARGAVPRRQPTVKAVAWYEYLGAHARRLYASVTDMARVAAALLATKITRGRVTTPFTVREVYRNEWTGLTEARSVQSALECLEELGWIRREAVREGDGGRPTVRFHVNPRLRDRRE